MDRCCCLRRRCSLNIFRLIFLSASSFQKGRFMLRSIKFVSSLNLTDFFEILLRDSSKHSSYISFAASKEFCTGISYTEFVRRRRKEWMQGSRSLEEIRSPEFEMKILNSRMDGFSSHSWFWFWLTLSQNTSVFPIVEIDDLDFVLEKWGSSPMISCQTRVLQFQILRSLRVKSNKKYIEMLFSACCCSTNNYPFLRHLYLIFTWNPVTHTPDVTTPCSCVSFCFTKTIK